MNEKFCVHEGMCVVFMQADWPVISCQADMGVGDVLPGCVCIVLGQKKLIISFWGHFF